MNEKTSETLSAPPVVVQLQRQLTIKNKAAKPRLRHLSWPSIANAASTEVAAGVRHVDNSTTKFQKEQGISFETFVLTALEWRVIAPKLVDHQSSEAVTDEVNVAIPIPPWGNGVKPARVTREEKWLPKTAWGL